MKNEHDALDIIGEATYKGLKELHTLKQPEYFDTWMTRIVINAAIDYIRKNTSFVYCEEDTIGVMKVTESGCVCVFRKIKRIVRRPTEINETTSEGGATWESWNIEGVQLRLYQEYELSTLEMTWMPDAGE